MKPQRIIHFGDIHLWQPHFDWSDAFFLKRYTGYFNLWLKRRKKFPPELGEAVVNWISKQQADLVIFTGDCTTAAHKEEFANCAKLFEPLYQKWGERFVIIPGNHDRYTSKSTREDWYGKALPYGKIKTVRCLEIDSSTTLIAYDASRPFYLRSNGDFTQTIEKELEEALKLHRDKRILLVGHYPVHYPQNVAIHWQHEMLKREQLAKLLKKYPISVYLHGHKHIRWRLDNHLNCGSAGMLSKKENEMAGCISFELNPNLTKVQAHVLVKEEKKEQAEKKLTNESWTIKTQPLDDASTSP